MSAVEQDRKPGLVERIGSAVNASNLSTAEGKDGAVDKLLALAYTQINPGGKVHGAREQGEIDPRAELGALLIRIKAGGQHREMDRAVAMLVHWVRKQAYFKHWDSKLAGTVLPSLVRQCLAEWLWPVCTLCQGIGWVGIERDTLVSKRITCRACKGAGQKANGQGVVHQCEPCRGFGKMARERVRESKPRLCPQCNGVGSKPPRDHERARALGISVDAYQRHWVKRFDWMRDRLDGIDNLELRLLRSALGQGINHGSNNESA